MGISPSILCIKYNKSKIIMEIVVSKRGIAIILGLSLLLVGSGYFINESADVLQSRSVSGNEQEENGEKSAEEIDFIKWVEFDVTCEAMSQAYQYDIDTYTKEVHLNWVDLLAYLGAKYGGDFSKYKEKDIDKIRSNRSRGCEFVEYTKSPFKIRVCPCRNPCVKVGKIFGIT